ncbi:MAG: methylated-DNA--[protein]-cysteine S-methyltransferase [Chloroflexota bacterium]|nr:methylated-DNA--[protein]-cysteine S-methyltransferase [Chloroflexota bacterium]
MHNQDAAAAVVSVGTANTALGSMGAVFTSSGVARLAWGAEAPNVCAAWIRRWLPHAIVVSAITEVAQLAGELEDYFAGQRQSFAMPVDLRGTPFQLHVWHATQRVAYGKIRTYGQIAASIGHPHAARAVGAANGANPVPILVPCHRLVGSTGALISYRGGVAMKRHLLQLEGVLDAAETTVPRRHLSAVPASGSGS